MQFMSSESEQLSVLAHTNDAFIRTDKQTDFESQSDLLCILSNDFLYRTINFFNCFNFFTSKILMEAIECKDFSNRRWEVFFWDCCSTKHLSGRQ